MRVFVTGGTGAIGRYAVPALVAAGHHVTAIARSPAKADRLQEHGASPAFLSLFDLDALTHACAGHDAVANLATAIPSSRRFLSTKAWADNVRIRGEGSATVVAAALAAGVPRLVQESVVMIYRDGGERWIDESWPTDHFPAAETNHAAEASSARYAATGGASVILRLGQFYGTGAAHSEELLALARHRVVLSIGAPGGYQSSIHVADAGAAVVAALTVAPGLYNVVDDEPLTKARAAAAASEAVERHPHLRVPGRAGALFGHHLTALNRSLRVTNAAFRAAAGWSPRYPSLREGLAAMAAGERAH